MKNWEKNKKNREIKLRVGNQRIKNVEKEFWDIRIILDTIITIIYLRLHQQLRIPFALIQIKNKEDLNREIKVLMYNKIRMSKK